MKRTLRRLLALLGMVLGMAIGMLDANAQNVRGFYLNNVNGWLGDTAQENGILRYAQANSINYIIMYDLGAFDFGDAPKKNKLAAFISRAKLSYGVYQFAASGEIYQFFRDNIIPFNRSRFVQSERFDVFNYEFEFWVLPSINSLYCARYLAPGGYSCDTAGAWAFSWKEFKQVDSAARANGLLSEYYLGWPTQGQMQQVVRRTGRLLLHAYRPTDVDVYSYSKNRLRWAGSAGQYVAVATIFSSEQSFMGAWLQTHTITQPYQTYLNGFAVDTGSWKQYINLQGYTWFTYSTQPSAPPQASISFNGPLTFCAGGSVTLTANTGTQYLWSPGGQTTRSITVNQAGTYQVRVTKSGGQNAWSQPVTVSVTTYLAPPTIFPTGPTWFCAGGSVTLTASPADSFLWSNGATTRAITATLPGAYTVTAYGGGGCRATSAPIALTRVTSVPTPTVTADGSSSTCGAPVLLTSTEAHGYLWSNGAQSRSIVVTAPGTYYVTAYGGPGCSAQSLDFAVTRPTASATPTVTPSGSLVLSASHPYVTLASSYASGGYLWSTGETTRSINVYAQGSYRVTATVAGRCPATSSATIVSANGCTPPAAPTVTPNGSTVLVLGHSSVNLTSSVASGYLWSTGATTRTVVAYNAGTYSVRAYNAGYCFSTSAPVIVYAYLSHIVYNLDSVQASSEVGRTTRSTDPGVLVFPNPSAGDFRVQFDAEDGARYTAVAYDLAGREAWQSAFVSPSNGRGEFSLSIDRPGVYFIRVVGGSSNFVVRAVVQ